MKQAGEAQVRDFEQLWMDYKHRQDLSARDELVKRHLHLVKYIAGRLVVHLPPTVEMDDLLSYGVFGLLDALEKFDVRRGIKFETYAYTRIRGAMLDGLRSMDWVPQSLRKREKEVVRAIGKLEAKLGRPAEDEEVAEELGVTLEELQRLMVRLQQASVLSLHDLLGNENGDGKEIRHVLADPQSPAPLEQAVWKDAKGRLAKALAALPHRERLIITLYYDEGLTVKEIGEVLGLSASRISQLHGRALLRLRGAILGRDA